MTETEYEAWLYSLETENFCRYCGAELKLGEVDICDSCYDSEQLRM